MIAPQPNGGPPQGSGRQPRWSREQIRAARLAPLLPLLQKQGLQLIQRPADNFELPTYPGLIFKVSYWRWPPRNLAGNTIDFCSSNFNRSRSDICLRAVNGGMLATLVPSAALWTTAAGF